MFFYTSHLSRNKLKSLPHRKTFMTCALKYNFFTNNFFPFLNIITQVNSVFLNTNVQETLTNAKKLFFSNNYLQKIIFQKISNYSFRFRIFYFLVFCFYFCCFYPPYYIFYMSSHFFRISISSLHSQQIPQYTQNTHIHTNTQTHTNTRTLTHTV